MKKIVTFLLIGIFCISVVAHQKGEKEKNEKKSKIPAVEIVAFHKDYPDVKNVKWSSYKGDFEAELKLNKADCSANYDKSGQRVEVELDFETNQLPKAALDYISKNYLNYKISEAAKIIDEKNVISFEVKVGTKGKFLELIFDAGGKFLSKEAV
jgi:hypothetical protein